MRKILVLCLALVLSLSFAACGSNTTVSTDENGTVVLPSAKELTVEELEAELAKQEVRVVSTNYLVQDDEYKSLYPDLMQAVIQNDSEYDIKNAVIAYVAWDNNNLPVKIKGKYDYGDLTYVKQCDFDDINLVPGASYGEDSGMALAHDCDSIKTFKAILVSYETFDGETWSNPHYNRWVEIYSGKKIG